jgi:hypothetical protein
MQTQVPDEGRRAEAESPRRAPGSTRWRGMRGRNARAKWEGRKAGGGLLFPAFVRTLVRVVSSCSVSGDAQRRQIDVDDTAHDGCCSPGVMGVLSLRSLSTHYSKPCGSRTATGPSSRKPRRRRKTNWRRYGSRRQAARARCGGCPRCSSTSLHVPPRAWEPGGAGLSCMNSCRRTLVQNRRPRYYSVLGGVPRARCGFVGSAEGDIPKSSHGLFEIGIRCEWNPQTEGKKGATNSEFIELRVRVVSAARPESVPSMHPGAKLVGRRPPHQAKLLPLPQP